MIGRIFTVSGFTLLSRITGFARDIVLAAYRLGSADLIDFLDAQRSFRDTLRTYNRALYERRVSAFQLAAATGVAAISTQVKP